MKCVILENLSTTTKIESLPFFYLGKPKIKSIEISTQGLVGNGVYNPCGCTLDFAFLQAIHKFVAHPFLSLASKDAYAIHPRFLQPQSDPLNHTYVLHEQRIHIKN